MIADPASIPAAGFDLSAVVCFAVLALSAFALDMWAHRGDQAMPLRLAVLWTLFWIAIGLSFAAFMHVHRGPEAAALYLAGYLIEQALSVDNLFVMMAIFAWFKVPAGLCHRVLFWGALGAVVFRLIFVLIGTALFALGPVMELVFAALVAASGVMMIRHSRAGNDGAEDISGKFIYRAVRWMIPVFPRLIGHNFLVSRARVEQELQTPACAGLKLKRTGPWFATPLLLCLAVIETTDLMFAFDSVPAVIAVSREPLIVYASMIFAVMGLRSMYFVLDGLRRYLVHLEKAVMLVLFFTAIKLAASACLSLTGVGFEVSVQLSLLVIAALLGLGVLASLIFPGKKTSSQG